MAGAYRVIDRRGSSNGRQSLPVFQTNNLYPAATPNSDRRSVPSLDYDGYNLVTPQGRRNLMTSGRRLMASNSVVRAAVNDMVRLSASNYQMHFHTSDNEWNNAAEELLRRHDLICDSRGQGYSMRTITEFLVKGPTVDGDIGVLKYFTPTGYPMFQVVPSHRVTSPAGMGSGEMIGGRYDGARYIDGVVVNDYLRPIAYLIAVGSDQKHSTDVMAVPAQDILLAYVPEYPDQVRGYSQLGASIFDWQDIQDTRYAIDPTKAGGAQMRVVVEKINRTILHIQRTLIEPCRKQLDNWRINVFMQRGDLPYNEEWFKYRYQVPAKLTADAKYQSQVDITEYAAGFTTHERIAANRSSNWEDDQDQKAREIKRAMNLAESMGIPVAYLLSGVANTNVLTQSLNTDAEQTPQNSD
jgi:hypothetical protein